MTSPYGSEDDDPEAAAMAAAMGFSSFGSHKPPAKKRKFNPTTDAFVEGQELESIDRGGRKGKGSGGNDIPLGKARVFGQLKSDKGNEDKIDLDLEDDVEGDGHGDGGVPLRGPQYIDASLAPLAEDNEEDGPQYLDTSLPAPMEVLSRNAQPLYEESSEPAPATVSEEEAAEMQRRIDAILESIDSAPSPPRQAEDSIPSRSTLPPPPKDLPNRPAYSDTAFMQGGSRGGFGHGSDTTSITSSRGGRGHGGSRSGRGGEKNERWYEGYYDPSFNENPWKKLEMANGLKPVGTWLEREAQPSRSGR
jgi:hypothetical protein